MQQKRHSVDPIISKLQKADRVVRLRSQPFYRVKR